MHTTLYSIIYILTFFDQLFGFAIFNKGAYLIYISIYQKALNLFNSIMKTRSNSFLEPISTKQYG